MPEDRFGVTGRITRRRQLLAVKLNKRNRRLLTMAGLPLMAIAAASPLVISHLSAKSHQAALNLPSRTLCTGWMVCTRHGYPSYKYQARAYRSYWRMTAGDECTNYAAYVESTVYHVRRPGYLLGNGGQWADAARAHGVLVDDTPSVGSVAVWGGGAFGIGPMGHVAVVEAVGPHDRYILISQQHIASERNDYDWTKIKAHYPPYEWQEWPNAFIHFRIPRRADIGYYDPRTGNASLRYSQTNGPANASPKIGRGSVIPLVGRWHKHGPDTIGFYNPKYGTFHLIGAGTRRHPNLIFRFGPRHMVPLVGDWTGAGHDGIGYYNPRTGTFYLREKLSRGKPLREFRFGPPHMRPLAGDWNGGRRDGIGYYNPRTGVFAVRNALRSGPAYRKFRFGPPHMIPLVGNWNASRWAGVGYYDPWTGTFYLRYGLRGGRPSVVVRFGPRLMVPLTGQWFTF